jgi:hypothetical protein
MFHSETSDAEHYLGYIGNCLLSSAGADPVVDIRALSVMLLRIKEPTHSNDNPSPENLSWTLQSLAFYNLARSSDSIESLVSVGVCSTSLHTTPIDMASQTGRLDKASP